jgi:hypothetical protein
MLYNFITYLYILYYAIISNPLQNAKKNKAEMSNKEFTLIKEAKNKELLITCYKFVPYKLIKLQITSIKVISLI